MRPQTLHMGPKLLQYVLILMYMCPQLLYMCPQLLCMCPHTTIYASAYIVVRIRYVCVYIRIRYVCVLILRYMRPQTLYMGLKLPQYVLILMYVSAVAVYVSAAAMYVSSYYDICVRRHYICLRSYYNMS